ncbi:MAG TPA: hypothetical protein DCK95_08625 [Anaerolineaceae bacterium]|nr:hypothetical protein [Anaerolineaceae bacterium]
MEKQATPGKKFGYFVAMVINAALIYVFEHLLAWNIPYLLPTFAGCLWAIRLSLSVTIFVNFIYIFYDVDWFHHLMQVIENVFSWISVYFIYSIFPFEFPAEMWNQGVKIALIIILVLIPIGTLVELIQFFRKLNRQQSN